MWLTSWKIELHSLVRYHIDNIKGINIITHLDVMWVLTGWKIVSNTV